MILYPRPPRSRHVESRDLLAVSYKSRYCCALYRNTQVEREATTLETNKSLFFQVESVVLTCYDGWKR